MVRMSNGRTIAGRKAFTLMELLIVLVILVAVAGIMIPLMTGYVDKAHSGAAAANIESITRAVETYKVKHLFKGYPDYWDSLCSSSGTVWTGVPAAAAACLTPLALDAQQASSLNSAGINNLADSSTVTIPPANPAGNATFDKPTTSFAVAAGANVMQVSTTGAGLAALNLNVPNWDTTGTVYNYVLLGLGDSCTIIGTDIAEAPVHFDTIDPSLYYQHYGAIFQVPVTNGPQTGTAAQLVAVVGIHDAGLSGLRDHLTEFNQTNQ